MVTTTANRPYNAMIYIHRQLKRFNSETELMFLAKRLFQKDPRILERLVELVENWPINRRRSEIRHFIIHTIELALKKQAAGLPEKAESYVSFCDLTFTFHHSARKVWNTFVLRDFPADAGRLHDPETGSAPVVKLRKMLKKQLCGDGNEFAASVQTDVKELEDIDMVLFRIVSLKKSPDESKTEKRMLAKAPTYLAYFTGEPYFYANSANPNPDHCQALVDILNCTSYSAIPLAGKYLESLRQLRINRDDSQILPNNNWLSNDDRVPMIDSYSVSTTASIADGNDEFPLSCSIRLGGSDVLNGLRNSGILSSSTDVPNWVKKMTSRGRNKVTVKPANPPNSGQSEADIDQMSDITAMISMDQGA